jgi:hypothetical protein
MLDVKIIPSENNKVVLDGLQRLGDNFRPAAMRGAGRAAAGIYEGSLRWLSGSGGAGKKKRRDYVGFHNKKTGKDQMFREYMDSGGYPVPVRTGHLRRMSDWLAPGESKSGDVGTITAGENEFLVFNSASYALAVFEGLGSSAKFGPRNAIMDAFEYFNHGGQIQQLVSEEVRREINKT